MLGIGTWWKTESTDATVRVIRLAEDKQKAKPG